MRFRHFDNLRLFDVVARHMSFTSAAEELHLTKGAISYQIKRLEEAVGFDLFIRQPRGIALTQKGTELWHLSQRAFTDLERDIARLREETTATITIGMSTYFASRWLSARLMTFMGEHPDITLRIQPAIDLRQPDREGIDIAIRWGPGGWKDLQSELLFNSPAMPTAGHATAARVRAEGLKSVLPGLTLLQDREGSVAWEDWLACAGFSTDRQAPHLVIPDPNVRVQAVIDGQGIALNDRLVARELAQGLLFRISDVELPDYGYHLVYPPEAMNNPALRSFRDWLVNEARTYLTLEGKIDDPDRPV